MLAEASPGSRGPRGFHPGLCYHCGGPPAVSERSLSLVPRAAAASSASPNPSLARKPRPAPTVFARGARSARRQVTEGPSVAVLAGSAAWCLSGHRGHPGGDTHKLYSLINYALIGRPGEDPTSRRVSAGDAGKWARVVCVGAGQIPGTGEQSLFTH